MVTQRPSLAARDGFHRSPQPGAAAQPRCIRSTAPEFSSMEATVKAAYKFAAMGFLAVGLACEHAPTTVPVRSSHAPPSHSVAVQGTAVATQTIHVEAYIDGESQLILHGNTARWFHIQWTAPGLYGVGVNYPTKINGQEWFPIWP